MNKLFYLFVLLLFSLNSNAQLIIYSTESDGAEPSKIMMATDSTGSSYSELYRAGTGYEINGLHTDNFRGQVYWAERNSTGSNIYRSDLNNFNPEYLTSLPALVEDLHVCRDTNIVFLEGDNKIYKYSNSTISVISASNFYPTCFAVDELNQRIFTNGYQNGYNLIRSTDYNGQFLAQNTYSTDVRDMDCDNNGNLYISSNNGIDFYDFDNQTESTLFDLSQFSGSPYIWRLTYVSDVNPYFIFLNASNTGFVSNGIIDGGISKVNIDGSNYQPLFYPPIGVSCLSWMDELTAIQYPAVRSRMSSPPKRKIIYSTESDGAEPSKIMIATDSTGSSYSELYRAGTGYEIYGLHTDNFRGQVYWAERNSTGSNIYRSDLNNFNPEYLTSLPALVEDLHVCRDTNIVFLEGSNKIYKYSNSTISVISASNFYPTCFAVDELNQRIFTKGYQNGYNLIRSTDYNGQFLAQHTYSTDVRDMDCDYNGNLYISSNNGIDFYDFDNQTESTLFDYSQFSINPYLWRLTYVPGIKPYFIFLNSSTSANTFDGGINKVNVDGSSYQPLFFSPIDFTGLSWSGPIGTASGIVYLDSDSSGSYNSSSDFGIPNQILKLSSLDNDGQTYLTTNQNGRYSFGTDTGNYVLEYTPLNYFVETNDTDSINFFIDQNINLDSLNFGLIPQQTKADPEVSLVRSTTVCNENYQVWISVRNMGTENLFGLSIDYYASQAGSGIVSVSDSSNVSINGNLIQWNFPSFFLRPYSLTGDEYILSVTLLAPAFSPNLTLTDSVRIRPFNPSIIDLDYSNNFGSSASTLFCSYDPNDKQIVPQKCLYDALDTLDVTVRFQNTGNYPARRVVLLDTLDLSHLELLDFRYKGSSHENSWRLMEPSVLEVRFDSIYLVDSSVSFEESQGFFKYQIVVKELLPDSQTSATATSIYFDLNDPIVTNAPEVNFTSDFYVQTVSEDVNCFGGNDGFISLNPLLGLAPYQVAWSNNSSSLDLVNLEADTFSFSITDANNCRIEDTLVLSEPVLIETNQFDTICQNQSIQVGTSTYNISGTYVDILNSNEGCDSVVISSLTVNPTFASTESIRTCNPYTWIDSTYNTSGTYTRVATAQNGCDSISVLNLTIDQTAIESYDSLVSCERIIWNGIPLNSSGDYQWPSQTTDGCDSVANLSFILNTGSVAQVDTTVCDQLQYGGEEFSVSGSYSQIYQSSNGCDSVINLDIIVNPSYSRVLNTTFCYGDSLIVGNNIYSQTGQYTDLLVSSLGCDSIITSFVTVVPQVTGYIGELNGDLISYISGGNTPYYYQWSTGDSVTRIDLDENGLYWLVVTDANGCVSDTLKISADWLATGIAGLDNASLNITPNPAVDFVVLNSPKGIAIDKVELYSPVGQLVTCRTEGLYTSTASIDVSHIAKGVYIIAVQLAEARELYQILIE